MLHLLEQKFDHVLRLLAIGQVSKNAEQLLNPVSVQNVSVSVRCVRNE